MCATAGWRTDSNTMFSPTIDNDELLPSIVTRVTLQAAEESRLSALSNAESQHALWMMDTGGVGFLVGADKDFWKQQHIIHNAKAIAHAGKALECFLQALCAVITNKRLTKPKKIKSHALAPLYTKCLEAVGNDEVRENLKQAVDAAYCKVVAEHTSEVHEHDGTALLRITQNPFGATTSCGMRDGVPVYENNDGCMGFRDAFSEDVGQALQKFAQCPDSFQGYLERFDKICEIFVRTSGGKWRTQDADWRWADYAPREDSDTTRHVRPEFFGRLMREIMPILADPHFWHPKYQALADSCKQQRIEKKVLVLVRQSWPKALARKAMSILQGQCELQAEHYLHLDRPTRSIGDLDFIRKRNITIHKLGKPRSASGNGKGQSGAGDGGNDS